MEEIPPSNEIDLHPTCLVSFILLILILVVLGILVLIIKQEFIGLIAVLCLFAIFIWALKWSD